MYKVSVLNVKVENPRRNKILSFVEEKGQVTKNELVAYINSLNEEEGATRSSWSYITSHPYFFKIRENAGTKVISLSAIGKRVLAKTAMNECATFDEVVKETYPDLSDTLIKILGARSGIDLSNYDTTQIKLGMTMTLETNGSGAEDDKFDLFGIDIDQIFLLVVGNLTKDKNYYLKLSQKEVVDFWPNNGDEELPSEVSVDDFNELWDEVDKDDDDEDEDDDDDTSIDKFTGKDDSEDGMLQSLACGIGESEDTFDASIDKIAKAYMVRKETVEKEFTLGVMIESRLGDEEGAKKKALMNIASNIHFYSTYAKMHWDDMTEEEKKLAEELTSLLTPAFIDPMPEPDDPDKKEAEDKVTTKNVEFTPQSIPGDTQVNADAAPSGDVAESSDNEILNIGKSDDDVPRRRPEEWEQENTGKEQVLLDDENKETLLTPSQKKEVDDYIEEHNGISEDKVKEFAEKFNVSKSLLLSYVDINGSLKENYEIGKRYTIDGKTGIVIAVSESHVVMSQRGKMVLVEKELKDEFDGGASEEDSKFDDNEGEEIILGNKDDFKKGGNEDNLDAIPQNAGLTPETVYARKAAGPSNFFHNSNQQGPKRTKSRRF